MVKKLIIASALLVMVGTASAGKLEESEEVCQVVSKMIPVFQEERRRGVTEGAQQRTLMKNFDMNDMGAKVTATMMVVALSEVYEKPSTTTQSGFYRQCVDESAPIFIKEAIKAGH